MKPLNLSCAPPRSCREQLDGLLFLPRTIDKLRALLPGGDPGCYFINGKIVGISGFLISSLGVTLEEMLASVADARDDDEVAAWLRRRTDVEIYPRLNKILVRLRPEDSGDIVYFREVYAETLAQHPDLGLVLDIIEADDRRMFGPERSHAS